MPMPACRRRSGAATSSRRHRRRRTPTRGARPLPSPIRSLRLPTSCATGSTERRLPTLEADPGNQLAGALARLGRAVFGSQS